MRASHREGCATAASSGLRHRPSPGEVDSIRRRISDLQSVRLFVCRYTVGPVDGNSLPLFFSRDKFKLTPPWWPVDGEIKTMESLRHFTATSSLIQPSQTPIYFFF